jgi:hypothetical protein
MLSLDLGTIDRQTGGKLGTIDVPCPICGPERRSTANQRRKVLRVWRTDGGFAGYCCARCGASGYARDDSAPAPDPAALAKARAEAARFAADTSAERTSRAMSIWRAADHPAGTAVETYLAGRGLELPGDAAGEAIRFHMTCPFMGERAPAMVALVRDIRTNKPVAIHRTVLTPDGHKGEVNGQSRAALGPTSGGAIKLTADADVTTCLGIGEGIESTLSLLRLPAVGPHTPIWSLIDAGHVEQFPVLAGIEGLFVGVDNDESGTGQHAAEVVANRWLTAGVEVIRVVPNTPGQDLNDLVRGAAR